MAQIIAICKEHKIPMLASFTIRQSSSCCEGNLTAAKPADDHNQEWVRRNYINRNNFVMNTITRKIELPLYEIIHGKLWKSLAPVFTIVLIEPVREDDVVEVVEREGEVK